MSEKKEYENLKLENVRVRYAKVIRPGKAYDEAHPDEWSVNLYVTDEDRETLMSRGINPKEDKDGNEYFITKRSVVNKAGDEVKPPTVVDGRKQPFTQDLGNGSVCNIAVTPFAWTMAKKSGVLLYLNAVQVVNHVAYSSNTDVFGIVDTGNAVSEKGNDLPF